MLSQTSCQAVDDARSVGNTSNPLDLWRSCPNEWFKKNKPTLYNGWKWFENVGVFTIQWDILDGRWFFQVLTTKRSLSIGNITIDWWNHPFHHPHWIAGYESLRQSNVAGEILHVCFLGFLPWKPSISIGSIPIHQGESPCFLLSILDRSQTPSQTQIHLSVEAKHIKIHPKCRDCWFNAINHTNYKFTQKNRQFDASRNPKNMNLLDLDLAGSFPPTAPGQHGACPEPVERWAEEMLL